MESWLMISSGIILANFYGDDQLLYQTVSDCNYQIHHGFQRSQASRPTDAVCALRAPPARSGFDKALAQPSAESTGAPRGAPPFGAAPARPSQPRQWILLGAPGRSSAKRWS